MTFERRLGGRHPMTCPCGIKSCKNGSAKTHDKELRRKLKKSERIVNARLPTLERIEEVERHVMQFNAALEFWKDKSRLLDVDLSQRYILVQNLTLKLSEFIGAEAAEAFVRSCVPAPFVRTLGPLDPIFRAMQANELAGQAAAEQPELPLPDGFYPKLIEYTAEKREQK